MGYLCREVFRVKIICDNLVPLDKPPSSELTNQKITSFDSQPSAELGCSLLRISFPSCTILTFFTSSWSAWFGRINNDWQNRQDWQGFQGLEELELLYSQSVQSKPSSPLLGLPPQTLHPCPPEGGRTCKKKCLNMFAHCSPCCSLLLSTITITITITITSLSSSFFSHQPLSVLRVRVNLKDSNHQNIIFHFVK